MLMDGFFSKKLYAAKTERTFITKLNTLRCLECISCATFLSSSLMVRLPISFLPSSVRVLRDTCHRTVLRWCHSRVFFLLRQVCNFFISVCISNFSNTFCCDFFKHTENDLFIIILLHHFSVLPCISFHSCLHSLLPSDSFRESICSPTFFQSILLYHFVVPPVVVFARDHS